MTAEQWAAMPPFDSPGSTWYDAFTRLLNAWLDEGECSPDVRHGVFAVLEQWVENEYETRPHNRFDSFESVLHSLADMASFHAEGFLESIEFTEPADVRAEANNLYYVSLAAGYLSGRLHSRLPH